MSTPTHDTPLSIALRLRDQAGETDPILDLDKLIGMLRQRQRDDWRRCPGCGHEGMRGSVEVSEADIGVWPVIADLHGHIWRRTEIGICSTCETITVAHTPIDPDSVDPQDQLNAKLLQPEVLDTLRTLLAGAIRTGEVVMEPEEGDGG